MDKLFVITEGIAGVWHYHISKKENPIVALCGAKVMHTYLSFDAWGVKGHLNEQYCERCMALAKQQIVQSPIIRELVGTRFVIMNVSKTKVLCKEGIGWLQFDNEKKAKKEARTMGGVVIEIEKAKSLLEANRNWLLGIKDETVQM
jgi:hypothetical protein